MSECSHVGPVNYDDQATAYARNRRPHSGVLHFLTETAARRTATSALEVGVGSGNFLSRLTGVSIRVGIDPSAEMLRRAGRQPATTWLVQGQAEKLPFEKETFDFVYSVDVIHHIEDREHAAREALRVLRCGGWMAIATDSYEDISNRVPLASHFPDTVAVERSRYPEIETIHQELAEAGFQLLDDVQVSLSYDLSDIRGYQDRSFSSLRFISRAAFDKGIERLRDDLSRGPIRAASHYTIVVAAKP